MSDSQVEEPRAPEEPARRRRRLPAIKVLVPWILFFVAAVAAVTLGALLLQQRSEDDLRVEARETARSFATALTNFSHETIDQDAQEIRSFAVGAFEQEVDAFFGPDAVAAIKEAAATSTGEIVALFVQSLEDDEASVFAVVEVTIANSATDEPQTDLLRMELGMIRTGGRWKVGRVDLFQSPGGGLPGAG